MNKQIETITNLFKGNEIRSVWNSEKEDYYFSVIDVISALTNNEYQKARNYWKWLKNKLNSEGSELVSNTNQLRMKATDGKMRQTDVLDTEGIFRLIESIPSPNAEPFKVWLAKLGRQEVDNVFDPSKEIARRGGNIAKNTRDNLEKELGATVISAENSLGYKYIDYHDVKQIK